MRTIYLVIFLSCIGLIGYAIYLQEVKELLPCPLCVIQRIAYWLICLTALFAFFHDPQLSGRRLYSGLMIGFALAGAIVAGRQAWLVRFPQAFECGISPEEAFLNALSLAQWWPDMFEANGDCADNNWQFLTLTIPDWSLIAFLLLGGTAAYLWQRKR